MPNRLILVADDAGFASTDRGIVELAEFTDAPISAEYMILQAGAVQLARAMQRRSLAICLGLHFELPGITDAERCAWAGRLAAKGECLAEQPEVRTLAERSMTAQLEMFREAVGRDPAHISTHGNFNTADSKILPWWKDLMVKLFGANVPPMQIEFPVVRHHLYSWAGSVDQSRLPMEPAEFGEELAKSKVTRLSNS